MNNARRQGRGGKRHAKVRYAPSISTRRTIVRFHCLPARAIRRSLRSPSTVLRCSGGIDSAVAFAARRVDSVAPEKNACTL